MVRQRSYNGLVIDVEMYMRVPPEMSPSKNGVKNSVEFFELNIPLGPPETSRDSGAKPMVVVGAP